MLTATYPGHSKTMAKLDLNNNPLRKDFPILSTKAYGKPLVYLDSAATSQKPLCTIEAMQDYYLSSNANVHRGVHYLSERATSAFEGTRKKVAQFINAPSEKTCIFVRGTTEAVNLVATVFGQANVQAGDEVLISAMEHHSNIVPWQMMCERQGATLKTIPMNDKGELILDTLDDLLSSRTKIVSVGHASNALGTIHPIKTIIDKAHAKGIPVMVDGAQAAPHLQVDVQALDCDFYAFSGHKMYAPTGIGVLYGKQSWLENLPPYHGGGDMILSVSFEQSTYNEIPHKFEAGTPAIADVIGLGASIDYLMGLNWDEVVAHEKALLDYASQAIGAIPGVRLIGTAKEKIGVVSFTLDGVHPHDIATITDQSGVAIRAGHHCAMPIMTYYDIPATIRASLGLYNTQEDIDALVKALAHVKKLFKLS